MEDDDMTPICSVLVVVLLWYPFFAWLFFLQSITMVLSIITMVPFALFWSTREREREISGSLCYSNKE